MRESFVLEGCDFYDLSMRPPPKDPIGLRLARTAKAVSRAFDDALSAAGGSLPMWLILVAVKAQRYGAQRDLAEAVGVEGPTLTHHLNRMEAAGLLTRTRDPENRRVHLVELTDAGEATFQRLVATVTAFDQQLRRGLTTGELTTLSELLVRLHSNVATSTAADVTK
jgi:MarR family transcriptional regulator, transcriptional regulator for hemolysin